MRHFFEICLFASLLAFPAASSATHPSDINHDAKAPLMTKDEEVKIKNATGKRPILIIHVLENGDVAVRACPTCDQYDVFPAPPGSGHENATILKKTIPFGDVKKYVDDSSKDPCYLLVIAGRLRLICW